MSDKFFKAIKKVWNLDKIVKARCYGCQVHHPSQRRHDLCLSGYGEIVFRCYEEALNKVSRSELMQALVDEESDNFIDLFKNLFIDKDPLEQIKYDKEMQLEFICFVLDMKKPSYKNYTISSVCFDYDYLHDMSDTVF